VLPSRLNATLDPKLAPSPGFEALMYACCVTAPPRRVNTYTAPEL